MITIIVPCSTSNLGPGFDTLGLALDRFLTITCSTQNLSPQSQIKISVEGEGANHIPVDSSNLVYQAMFKTAEELNKTLPPLSLHLKNDIPSYGGLGGSGAAIAGGVFLANILLEGSLSLEAMLKIAVSLEGHPDNVSASLYGGLTINHFDRQHNVHSRSVKIPRTISVVTCSPHRQIQTAQARTMLPQQVALHDAVKNIQNIASLVAALIEGDLSALHAVMDDAIHERHRAVLIPGFESVKQAALQAGAASFNISGAGPTVFSFTQGNEREISDAMIRAFSAAGEKSTAEIMAIEHEGIRRIR